MAGSDIYKLAEYMEKLSKRTIQKFKSQMGINVAAPSSSLSKYDIDVRSSQYYLKYIVIFTVFIIEKAPVKDNKKNVRINDDVQDGEE